MAEQTTNVIKRTYDAYQNQDYLYGTDSATNLNPVREIKFDQIEVIRRRLQEVTDDIVRRKIIKEPAAETPLRVPLGGSLPPKNSMLRQAAQLDAGSIGLGIVFPLVDGPVNGIQGLLEPIIGAFPVALMLGDLDKPISLECEEILKQYDFVDDSSSAPDSLNDDKFGPNGENNQKDENGDGDDSGGGDNGSGDDGSGEDENNTDSLSDGSEFEECALIEMNWLKIILIILRIIKILQTILDIVLAILVPLLEIVMLALICWIVPPAAEQLRQRITEMVMALVIMIITKLIQMIFNLLNLDCLCNQTMDIINQIRQAIAAFSSIMSVLNVNSVKMMANNALDQLADPLDQIADIWNKKQEAWDKMKEEWTNLDLKEMWTKSKDQILTGAVNSTAQNPNVQKVTETTTAAINLIKNDIIGLISGLNKAKATVAASSTVKIEPGSATEENMLNSMGKVEME
jgi:hypothetical protein